MKKMFSFGVAIALLAISGAVMAYPSLLGPTGTGVLPNDVTVDRGAFDAAVDYFNNGDEELQASVIARVEYGIAENTEIGFAFTLQDVETTYPEADSAVVSPTSSASSYNSWSLNAKRTMAVNERFTGAFGVTYQDWHDLPAGDQLNFLQVYGLLGTTLPIAGVPEIRGCIGLNYVKADFGYTNDNAIRGFISLNTAVTEKLSVAVDFQTEDSDFDYKPLSSIVARYPISTRMNAQLGLSNAMYGSLGGRTHNLFLGLNMGFGGESM